MSNADDLKRQAAAKALELVKPGMRLGLGTGSFPVSEKLATELLSLSLFPGMTAAQVERVGM